MFGLVLLKPTEWRVDISPRFLFKDHRATLLSLPQRMFLIWAKEYLSEWKLNQITWQRNVKNLFVSKLNQILRDEANKRQSQGLCVWEQCGWMLFKLTPQSLIFLSWVASYSSPTPPLVASTSDYGKHCEQPLTGSTVKQTCDNKADERQLRKIYVPIFLPPFFRPVAAFLIFMAKKAIVGRCCI